VHVIIKMFRPATYSRSNEATSLGYILINLIGPWALVCIVNASFIKVLPSETC
jgi:hypothetical protein